MLKRYAAMFLIFGITLSNVAVGQSIINPADTIVNFTKTSNPTQPAFGTIGKWGRTPSLTWNTTEYKCYVLNGFPIRIHFPKTYVPGVNDGKIYPALVFWHGLGEAGPVTDNETSLFHGGQPFQTNVDNGTFDGYVIILQSTGYFAPGHYQAMVQILNYMVANNKLDPARINVNGLSAGGQATWSFFQTYPAYCSGVLPMSAMDLAYESSTIVNQLRFTPYWYFQGGEDTGPAPYTSNQVVPFFLNAGADFTYTLFPTQGHDTWDSAWLEPNFFPFIAKTNAANPWSLFGQTNFCPGTAINHVIGVVPGASQYQWELNGTLISSATTNTLTVTGPGSYTCRFMSPAGVWTNWSPVPLVITQLNSTPTPAITLAHAQSVAIPAPDGTTTVTMTEPTGDSLYKWSKLGSSTVLGTTSTYTATAPGDYISNIVPKFGCSGTNSPVFEVINANGSGAPTAATNVVGNALTFTKSQITWATQPNPTNPPTAFEVYRGTKATGPWTYLGQSGPSVLSWADSSGLAAGTQYFYAIRAIDTSGAAPLSTPGAVTTISDVVPPSAPANLAIQYTTNSSIAISWTAATDNVGVAKYNIYVNGTLADVTPNTSFIINGLTQGSWYSIYVVAADGSGNVSNPSNQVEAGAVYNGLVYNYYTSTLAANLTSVTQIPNLTLTAVGSSPTPNINLFPGTTVNYAYVWTGYITITKAGSYKFELTSADGSMFYWNSLTATGTATVRNDGTKTNATSATSTSLNLTAGSYPVCIQYFQSTGTTSFNLLWASSVLSGTNTFVSIPASAYAGTATAPVTVPAIPTGVTATATAYNNVKVAWTDNSNNETGFEVYRATSSGGPWGIVTTTAPAVTSFADGGVAASTTYFYQVQAINAAGGSGYDPASHATATTPALPAAPTVPVLSGTSPNSSAINLSWTETSPNVTSYTLNRSIGDSLHFQLLASPAGTATSYADNSLFGHQLYYYQLSATGPGGTSASTFATGVTTLDNFPTISALNSQTIRYGTTTTLNVNARDADGDALAFTLVNPPAFATLVDNGNGTAVLTLAPTTAQAGVYSGIGVSVSDGHGGTAQSLFTLTVNNNFPPVVTTVPAQSVNTGSTLNIPLTATSPSGDNMTFVVTGAPNNYTVAVGPNGSDTLKLNPTLAATGNYTVTVTVNDNQGGSTSTTFPLTVNFTSPVRSAYLRINDGDAVGAPWNNITGQVTTNILDNTGATTPWSFNLNTTWWGGAALGPTTGNNSGVYPDAILKDFYFFGAYGAPNTIAPTLTGLDPTKLYNLTLFASSVFNDVSNNGTTVYTIGSQSLSLNVQDNLNNTVTFTNVSPDNTGTITINMAKANDGVTPLGYINALVVTQNFSDGSAPLSPYNLTTALTASGNGVVLTWSDSAYNETGYEIWRATNSAGPWTQVLPNAAAKATTYTDSTTAGFTTYYYKVQAVNANGVSNYTNVATISTPDKVPTLAAIPNISLNWGTSDTVHVTTTNNTGNTETLVASGLPAFATFIDNGNGTGQLIINAPDSATGTYNTPVITMTDQADSVRTDAFSITVKNPSVSTVYIHFSDGVNNGAVPWNNVSVAPAPGFTASNLLNDAGTNSGVGIQYQNGFAGIIASGERPGNGAGIYPDPVMRSCLYDLTTGKDSLLVTGLNPAQQYTFGIFSSTDWGVGGTTSFTLLGATQTINPGFNTTSLLQFMDQTPRANGTVSIAVSKAAAAQYMYFNDLVVQSYSATGVVVMGPSFLHATTITRTAITLVWQDNSWNETGYEVWRATSSGGPYTRLAQLAANTTTYTNSGLNQNTTYYYTVRAVKSTTPSTYSNCIAATTSSYAIYLQFNEPNLNLETLPWNSLNQQPLTGTTWFNFHDDLGNPTSTGMVLNGLWAGMSNLGMQTGKNSGAVPDLVMLYSYVLFAGQSGGFVVNGLNINETYDITFFGSINFQADASTVWNVNGVPVILNASLNTNGTVTVYGVHPDQNGNVTINVYPASASTEYGIVNAIIIRSYTPTNGTVPPAPLANVQNMQTITGVTPDASAALALDSTKTVSAYPNPFTDAFTLRVPVQTSGAKAMVQMYSVDGTTVYANEFKNLVAGDNYLTIRPDGGLNTGVYFVKVGTNDGAPGKTIKIIKQQ